MNDLSFDAQHIWHPYASLPAKYPLFEVVKTENVNITLKNGSVLIDGMSSWWCAIHGYNHPTLLKAMNRQINDFSHIMFGGLTHKPAIELSRQLLKIVPKRLDKIFFSDSGSVSVEVAIKIALQYQNAKGNCQKTKILALKGGYHGDTFMAMSVSDPQNSNHNLFENHLSDVLFTPKPECKFSQNWQAEYFAEIEKIIIGNHQNIAGFIVEPIVQSAGGMSFYHPNYLREINRLCDKYDILLIADEIATGFGRTGKLFACEYADISPDIMCIGKSLTGGMMSLAVTLTTKKISKTIAENPPFALMHGPTFMANPLACAVALASIDLLLKSDWQQNIKRIERVMKENLHDCERLLAVKEVRILGAIGVVELHNSVDMEIIQPIFVKKGVWIRPFGKLIYLMPSFSIKNKDLTRLCEVIYSVIKQIF